jgi:hypothetical protein
VFIIRVCKSVGVGLEISANQLEESGCQSHQSSPGRTSNGLDSSRKGKYRGYFTDVCGGEALEASYCLIFISNKTSGSGRLLLERKRVDDRLQSALKLSTLL